MNLKESSQVPHVGDTVEPAVAQPSQPSQVSNFSRGSLRPGGSLEPLNSRASQVANFTQRSAQASRASKRQPSRLSQASGPPESPQTSMGPPKRPASQELSHGQSKRKKVAEFNEELKSLLEVLDTVPGVYDFIPPGHSLKTSAGNAIFHANNIKRLLTATKAKPDMVIQIVQRSALLFPLYRELRLLNEFKSNFPEVLQEDDVFIDLGEFLQLSFNGTRQALLHAGNVMFPPKRLPTPSSFGRGNWPEMQASDNAILCHRPADKIPALPLKVKHPAFHEFFDIIDKMTTKSTVVELKDFTEAAINLEEKLCAPVVQEATRGSDIVKIFRKLFSKTDGYTWTLEHSYDQGRIDLLCMKTTNGIGCPHIMIEVKLEPGRKGDGYMQLCRMYHAYVAENPGSRIRTSGAPMFLLSISGMSTTRLVISINSQLIFLRA